MSEDMVSIAVVMGMPPSTIVVNCQQSAATSEDFIFFRCCFFGACLTVSTISWMVTGVNPRSRSQPMTSFAELACVSPSFREPDVSHALYLKVFIQKVPEKSLLICRFPQLPQPLFPPAQSLYPLYHR